MEYEQDFYFPHPRIAQLLALRTDENIRTVMRLNNRPPEDIPLTEYSNCENPRLQEWMQEIDNQYNNAFSNMVNNTDTVVGFIFLNEPNHHNIDRGTGDEGLAIRGEHYADLYNCYYQRWRNNNNHHPLLVAGPSQFGRPEGTLGEDDAGTEDYDLFLQNVLPNLEHGADGFAIHVYGYYGTQPLQQTLFIDMLNTLMGQIQNSALNDRPVLISEYNPGVPADPDHGDHDANNPVLGDGEAGWRDWFDSTYCWMDDYRPQVIGALYFTDDPDRDDIDQNGWWVSSLDNHDGDDDEDPTNRRQLWLEAPNPAEGEGCDDVRPQGLPSPLLQNYTLSSRISRSIGGVITGTLGVKGYDNIFTVTHDLEVPAGESLTIVPGTWLVFSPGQHMNIAGKLSVEANTVFPVHFISTDETGWSGIHFQSSANGSTCIGCYIENISSGDVAMQVDAPITFQEGRIRGVLGGTAISSTVPFTLSNTIIDHVGTALQVSGSPSATHTVSHLTVSLCQQGFVNQGQILRVDNSILTTCGIVASCCGPK